MTQDSRNRAYIEKVRELEQRFGSEAKLRRAVGGEFEGCRQTSEYPTCCALGLGQGDLIRDVGCGQRSMAHQLHHIKTSATSEQMSFPGWLRALKLDHAR